MAKIKGEEIYEPRKAADQQQPGDLLRSDPRYPGCPQVTKTRACAVPPVCIRFAVSGWRAGDCTVAASTIGRRDRRPSWFVRR